ncbi:MAG: UDP-N-acetylmuramate dehydrogenase [Firmicutes bacterium]|nr:UDP-N-acetylmuramate dehydrogenase [Bacillota bacterium]
MINTLEYLNNNNVRCAQNVGSERLSLYRGGGNLELVCYPEKITDFKAISYVINENCGRYFVFGGFSKTLVADKGFNGLSICTGALKGLYAEGSIIRCGVAERLPRVSQFATERGLKGLECLSGIPAEIGGAVYMNAGAFGSEIKDILKSVTVFDLHKSELKTYENSEIPFSYRSSGGFFRGKVIIAVSLCLSIGNKSEITLKASELKSIRSASQPPLPSLGSVFKNPKGASAGYLIERAGLKGKRHGGAMISERHANFIVNTGGGTASDYIALAEIAKSEVKDKFNEELKEEYICIK